jgi:glycosyltransferase involved in cell wall biosynthesis
MRNISFLKVKTTYKMKLPVYFFISNESDNELCTSLSIDNAFEKQIHAWNTVNSREKITELFLAKKPAVIVTVGESNYGILSSFHFDIRKRWLHFSKVDDIKPNFITSCFATAITEHPYGDDNPLLSVITSSYKSRDRILRPYKSLKNQTYTNWEWIIVDDTEGDDNWENLKQTIDNDIRIKLVKTSRHSGYIGEMKAIAAGIARGKWIIELDHDDEIVPELFNWIIQASRENPDVGFMYSDFIEVFEENNDPFSYGEMFAFGFGGYFKQRYNGRWQNVCQTQGINPKTARHIVGVPNHVRCWRKDVYDKTGGFNKELPVADDYELILKTFYETRFLRIAELGYIQYRNHGGNNFTFIRNALIQDIVRILSVKHNQKIHDRLTALGVEDKYSWDVCPKDWLVNHHQYPLLEVVWKPKKNVVSIVMPTYNRPENLKRAIDSVLNQTYENWELYIVGDNCPVIQDVMNDYFDTRIKWWNLEKNYGSGGAVPRNYALKKGVVTDWTTYLDDDNTWDSEHLQSLVDCMNNNPTSSYAFSSMKIDGKHLIFREPKRGRIDTSCVIHKTSLLYKYGYWKDRNEAGYAHDWEFFSRWKDEKYSVTLNPTLNYYTDYNSQTYEELKDMYDDQ